MQLRKHDNNAICETKIQSFPIIIIITLHYTCKLNNIIMVCYTIKLCFFLTLFIYADFPCTRTYFSGCAFGDQRLIQWKEPPKLHYQLHC